MISIKGVMEEQDRIYRESYQKQCQDFFESLPKGDLVRLAEFFKWVLDQETPSTPQDKPYVFIRPD